MEVKNKKKSQLADIWGRLIRNKQAVVGMIILGIMILVLIAAPLFIDYAGDVVKQNIPNRLKAPSLDHWFGTDSFGRDLFSRIIWGGRTSLFVAVVIAFADLIPGLLFGTVAAYYGKWVDNLIMRALDVISSLPPLLLAIAIVSSLGPGIKNLMIALIIGNIPRYSRIIRSATFSVKNQEFIEASRLAGSSDLRIILVHIIPNILAPVIITFTMNIGGGILGISGLSFLGLGIMPPAPEWGAILSEGKRYLVQAPWGVLIPGIFIGLTVVSFNFIGDGLRDALDPKLKD